ncbi:MAG: hypothetical protein ACPG8W_14105 [Candidatus Promineifilaceae bacterium]
MIRDWGRRMLMLAGLILVLGLIGSQLDTYNLIPRAILYRTYSSSDFPVEFDFPRFWQIESSSSTEVGVVKRFQKGVNRARGMIVTVHQKEAFLGDAQTIHERILLDILENDAAWERTLRFEQAHGHTTPYFIIENELGDLVEDKTRSRSGYWRAMRTPVPLTYQDGREWLFTPYVARQTIIFNFYVFEMNAVSEINDQIVEVKTVCYGGTPGECEILAWAAFQSVR